MLNLRQTMLCCVLSICLLSLFGCNSSPMTQARTTLTQFYDSLAAGRYAEAAASYGGSYETMIDWNRDVPVDDHIKLIEAACTRQLRCLPIKQIVSAEQLSSTEWRFLVEFANPDGSAFVRGPCCGASPQDQPLESQFEQRVVQTADGFRVVDLGVYVP